MFDEMLSFYYVWQKWCRMKKNGNEERREEREEIEEEKSFDQEN